MKYTILTLFPSIIKEYISCGVIKKAIDKEKISVDIIDLRQFGITKRKNTDDTIYGGGVGMLISVNVLDDALSSIKDINNPTTKIIYTTPKGKMFSETYSKELVSKYNHIVVICGHYEGIDERIFCLYNISEVSIGDFVITGGELASLVILDSVSRLVDGVLKHDAIIDESFEGGLLEEPKYTKPAEYKGLIVPEVLLSGNHEKVAEYRYEKKILETYNKRPDLFTIYAKKHKDLKEKINKIIEKKEE